MENEKCVDNYFLRALKLDPYITVSEWADLNRYLSSKSSAEPGRWRTARTPYLKEIMDNLSASSPVERTVFMKGAQIGGTETGNNWIGYVMDNVPGPMLLVMPTVDMAKDASRTRIDPMVEECPVLAEKVSDQKARDAANTALLKECPGGFLAMTGANSPAALRSKPIKYLDLDEVDAYPLDVGGEGDPVNLALARTRTFKRRKIFMNSTPTIEGQSRIQKLYEDSDQRKFFVPCPHCGGFQVLTWEHVKWEKDNPAGAWYECEFCHAKIYNHDKTFMLEKGEWRTTNPSYKGKTRGYHLSSLYSPAGWFSWGDAATMFVEAKTPELLKTFVNTVLGECWKDKGEAPDYAKLFCRKEIYPAQIPAGALLLVAGADVQKDRIEVSIMGIGRNREKWVIDHMVFEGDTADLADGCWGSLAGVLGRVYDHELGGEAYVRFLCVDSGFRTQQVYNWVRTMPINKVAAVKGRDSLAAPVGHPTAVDVVVNGQKKAKALKLWPVGVSFIKGGLYSTLRLDRPEEGPLPDGWVHFPMHLDEWYFKSLCSETLVEKIVKGRKHYEWVKIFERNEVLDTTVYAVAAGSLLQVEKFRAKDWDGLEKSLTVEDERATATVKKVEKQAVAPVIPGHTKKKRRIYSSGI